MKPGLQLVLSLALLVACAGRNRSEPAGSASGGEEDAKAASEESVPNDGSTPSDSARGVSTPTTGANPSYRISPVVLGGKGPYGSGDEMLALAGGKHTLELRSDDGRDELVLTITLEYDQYRPDRGEMWALVPTQRDASSITYGVVPVRVDVTSADGRIAFTIERAELVASESARAALEHVYGGLLTGTLSYGDFAEMDPACSQVRLLLDFRNDDLRGRVQFENELNAACKRWQTVGQPLPWQAALAP